jgi:hypothetical protein
LADSLNAAGGIPPASRNQRLPTGCDAPAFTAAASLLIPAATYRQNNARSSRLATGGLPGDRNRDRVQRLERRFLMSIARLQLRSVATTG